MGCGSSAANGVGGSDAGSRPGPAVPAPADLTQEDWARGKSIYAMTKWTPAEVERWLESLGFGKYAGVFRMRDVSGHRMLKITDRQLAIEFGIRDPALRAKLLSLVYGGGPDADRLLKWSVMQVLGLHVGTPAAPSYAGDDADGGDSSDSGLAGPARRHSNPSLAVPEADAHGQPATTASKSTPAGGRRSGRRHSVDGMHASTPLMHARTMGDPPAMTVDDDYDGRAAGLSADGRREGSRARTLSGPVQHSFALDHGMAASPETSLVSFGSSVNSRDFGESFGHPRRGGSRRASNRHPPTVGLGTGVILAGTNLAMAMQGGGKGATTRMGKFF